MRNISDEPGSIDSFSLSRSQPLPQKQTQNQKESTHSEEPITSPLSARHLDVIVTPRFQLPYSPRCQHYPRHHRVEEEDEREPDSGGHGRLAVAWFEESRRLKMVGRGVIMSTTHPLQKLSPGEHYTDSLGSTEESQPRDARRREGCGDARQGAEERYRQRQTHLRSPLIPTGRVSPDRPWFDGRLYVDVRVDFDVWCGGAPQG